MDLSEAFKLLAFGLVFTLFVAFVYICCYMLYTVSVMLRIEVKQSKNKTEEPSDR